MPLAFVAFTLIVSAILITRHYYLMKIEALFVAQGVEDYKSFRAGYDGGWKDGLDWGRKTPIRENLMPHK